MNTTLDVARASGVASQNNNVSYLGDELSPPVYMYIYVTLLNSAIFLVGVVGNAMVIYVMVRMQTMRTRVNYFLVSLSVADLLVLMVCQPSAMLVFYSRDRWLLGAAMCKLVPFFEHWTLHASVLTLLAIGFDRYFSICKPLTQQSHVCPAYTLIIPLWVIASLMALPFVFMTNLVVEEYHDGSLVQICRTTISSPMARFYVAASFVLMFLLPLLLLSFLYVSVISTLHRVSRNAFSEHTHRSSEVTVQTIHPSTARSRKQVARMMVAIVVLFFLSFLPFKILTLWLTFAPSHHVESLGFETFLNILSICRLVAYVNSAGNPVIYVWMCQRFRRAFRLSLQRCHKNSPRRGSFSPRQHAGKLLPTHRQPCRLHLDTPKLAIKDAS